MPLYEYVCQHCGQQSELLMKMSDPHPESCEHCQKGPMQKIVSKTSFVLKGEGWYETDFKDKTPANKASSSSTGTPASSESSSSTSTESGPSKEAKG